MHACGTNFATGTRALLHKFQLRQLLEHLLLLALSVDPWWQSTTVDSCQRWLTQCRRASKSPGFGLCNCHCFWLPVPAPHHCHHARTRWPSQILQCGPRRYTSRPCMKIPCRNAANNIHTAGAPQGGEGNLLDYALMLSRLRAIFALFFQNSARRSTGLYEYTRTCAVKYIKNPVKRTVPKLS